MPIRRAPVVRKAKKKYALPKTYRSEVSTGGGHAKKRPTSSPPAPSRPAPKTQPGPYRDKEQRKVTAHKRTRSYYNAYQAGFQENPKVKKAFEQGERGRNAGNKLLVLRATRTLERERRRGPDKLASDAYKHYTDRLWERARRYYPDSDKQPNTRVGYDGPKDAFAWTYKGKNTVYYSPKAIRQFMGPNKVGAKPNPMRSHAKSVPLHEWAHTRQREPAPPRSPEEDRARRAKREGGAEAVEQDLSKKLKIPYFANSKAYAKWAREMRRKYGNDWVHHGQYRNR
jgi:hypothetical protein